MNTREDLLEILKDLVAFATLKDAPLPKLYFLGGSGCILGNYLSRATMDFDFIDLNYPAVEGRLFKVLGSFDMLDLALTTLPLDFATRSKPIESFTTFFVLSKEDIVCSKIGRYSQKDQEDIQHLLKTSDKALLEALIEKVLLRTDLSPLIRDHFVINLRRFKEDFDV